MSELDDAPVVERPLQDLAADEKTWTDLRALVGALLTAATGAGVITSATGNLVLAALALAPAVVQYVLQLQARRRAAQRVADLGEQQVTPAHDAGVIDPVTLYRVPLVPLASQVAEPGTSPLDLDR